MWFVSNDADSNLLEATEAFLSENGYGADDVEWVACEGDCWMEYPVFARLAEGVSYYSGYGIREMRALVLMLSDGRWARWEDYDGKEGWSLVVPPTRPDREYTGGKCDEAPSLSSLERDENGRQILPTEADLPAVPSKASIAVKR